MCSWVPKSQTPSHDAGGHSSSGATAGQFSPSHPLGRKHWGWCPKNPVKACITGLAFDAVGSRDPRFPGWVPQLLVRVTGAPGISRRQTGSARKHRPTCKETDEQSWGRRPPTFLRLLELAGPCGQHQFGPDCEFPIVGREALFELLCLRARGRAHSGQESPAHRTPGLLQVPQLCP